MPVDLVSNHSVIPPIPVVTIPGIPPVLTIVSSPSSSDCEYTAENFLHSSANADQTCFHRNNLFRGHAVPPVVTCEYNQNFWKITKLGKKYYKIRGKTGFNGFHGENIHGSCFFFTENTALKLGGKQDLIILS